MHVVDDDANVRSSVARLLRSYGFGVELYESAADFLSRLPAPDPGCVLLDLSLPGMNGLELQAAISAHRPNLAAVFMTGQGDISTSVKAMKAGAIDFLTKPFGEEELIASVREALEKSRMLSESEDLLERDWATFQLLTGREKEVCLLVAQGLMNKQIAGELGPTEKTIKLHRAGVMRKLKVNSVADLVKLVERLRAANRL